MHSFPYLPALHTTMDQMPSLLEGPGVQSPELDKIGQFGRSGARSHGRQKVTD